MPEPDYQPPFRLDGKRALVTGAAQGIGAAIATALAAAGADVVLSGRSAKQLSNLAETLARTHDIRTAVATADLSLAASVEQLAHEGLEAFGGLDILVNNAGVSFPERVVDLSADLWDAVMAVNLRAPALLSSRVGKVMADAGQGGKIVNVASAAGLRALSEHYGYCVSKAALIMATKVLALELGPYGIQANAVCPTIIMTEMGQRVWGDEVKAAPMLARIPLGHFGVPADVANAVVFLSSPASDMVNGAALTIDGGFTVA